MKNAAFNFRVNNHLLRLDAFQKNIYQGYELVKKEFIDMQKSITNTLADIITSKKSLVKRLNLEIQSCDPKNVLKKGYSILSDKKGKLLKSTKTLINANDIIVEMHDGKVEIKKNNDKKLLD